MPSTYGELVVVSQPHLVGVHPVLAQRVLTLIAAGYKSGLYFAAFMGMRTWAEQAALYAKGRTAPGPKVTNAMAGDSAHNYGLAVDLVEDGDPDKAGVQWSWNRNADYIKLGSLAKSCWLEWGGWWKSFKDYPHVSLTCGLDRATAKGLFGHAGLPAVWQEVDRRLKVGSVSGGW